MGSSRLGLDSINSFGHILCREVPCLTVLGTRKLTILYKFLCRAWEIPYMTECGAEVVMSNTQRMNFPSLVKSREYIGKDSWK